MKITIKEIYSVEMFPGLIIGKPKDGKYDESLLKMKTLLSNDDYPDDNPIINISEIKWTEIGYNKITDKKKLYYGSWGHICGVKIQISDGDDRYNFSIIFNYLPENENLNNKIEKIISEINWKEKSFKWDIGDL